MGEMTTPCAFPRCSRPSRATVRLLVEGAESVLTTCQRHADWLRGYVEEDAAVRLVDAFSEDGSHGTIRPDLG